MAIVCGTLAKETNGVVDYVYPKTLATIVEYDNTDTVKTKIEKIDKNISDTNIRIDEIGNTMENALNNKGELSDIRIPNPNLISSSTTYKTAGDSVRGQFEEILNIINSLHSRVESNAISIINNENKIINNSDLVLANQSSINSNYQTIEQIKSIINDLQKVIGDQALGDNLGSGLYGEIQSHRIQIKALEDSLLTHTNNIFELTQDVDFVEQDISDINNTINNLQKVIGEQPLDDNPGSGILKDIQGNKSNIKILQDIMLTHTSNIFDVSQSVEYLDEERIKHANKLNELLNMINDLQAQIDANRNNISKNATDINTNKTNITTNANAIKTKTTEEYVNTAIDNAIGVILNTKY